MKMRIFIALSALVWLAGCGTPGAPRPPSLRLPQTVSDLSATRVGSTVTLTWTEPERTTDGEGIRKLGPTLICMGVNDYPMTHCDETVADLSQPQYASCAPQIGQPATCAVTLALELQGKNPTALATYAVEVVNTNGRSAGLSNQVRVPMAPALPAASNVRAHVEANAIVVEFRGFGVRSEYHVFRTLAAADQWVDLGAAKAVMEIDGGQRFSENVAFQLDDHSFEWGKTYSYEVVGLTAVQLPDGSAAEIRGDPSATVSVEARDIFPPAVPTGLQAVASGVGQPPFIDLTWAPNTESDLAGYNVYRHEEGQAPVKINAELVKAPAYRDSGVARGHRYFYAVSAVDLRGNESGKSAEASESVQ